mmetsp:Transcript_11697/g.19138  ORF Transcript_11697/g.19138 Transcript_11697/m.19138 type:complete len:219 (+) Transcript_11697:103-759(+)
MDPNTLTCILKVVNIINAALLAFSGTWVFITVNPNLLLVLAALYVITFSFVLLMFELKLESCNRCFLRNMGFMFNWTGRLLFFIFVGTLAFGLGVVGIVIGAFTMINAAINVTIVCVHPTFFANLREKAEAEVRAAVASEAKRQGVLDQAERGLNYAAAAGVTGAQQTKEAVEWAQEQKQTPGSAALPAGWREVRDEQSGEAYWINSATGEQTWELPT